MLFFIALLPFTTTLTSEYGYLNQTFIYYWSNVGFIGLISFFIQLHIGNPSKKLSVGLEDAHLRHYALAGALFTSVVFFLGAVMAMFGNTFLQVAAKYIYVLIFPGMFVLKKVYKVKNKAVHSSK
jgi:hypothetical protein